MNNKGNSRKSFKLKKRMKIPSGIKDARFCNKENIIGVKNKELVVFDLTTQKERNLFSGKKDLRGCFLENEPYCSDSYNFSPNRNSAVVAVVEKEEASDEAMDGHQVIVFETNSGRIIQKLNRSSLRPEYQDWRKIQMFPMRCAISPDGKKIAVVGYNNYSGNIYIHENKSGKIEKVVRGDYEPRVLAFSHDDNFFAYIRDRAVIYNLNDGNKQIVSFRGYEREIEPTFCAFSPNKKIFILGADSFISIIDLASKKIKTAERTRGSADIKSCEFSPDGKLVALLLSDQTMSGNWFEGYRPKDISEIIEVWSLGKEPFLIDTVLGGNSCIFPHNDSLIVVDTDEIFFYENKV